MQWLRPIGFLAVCRRGGCEFREAVGLTGQPSTLGIVHAATAADKGRAAWLLEGDELVLRGADEAAGSVRSIPVGSSSSK
eukprot:6462720-Amphidinium_carterae.2